MTLQEPCENLSGATLDLHRAIISLREELEAVDFYRQRSDACGDATLKEIMLHNMREEIEHASMLMEWIRRNNKDFAGEFGDILFKDGPIAGDHK
ncbi:MAG: ferritin [Rhodospirillales bacterium RIFCSPLOWO2_12_FULL_58_28]|nr:MAG: ferritin [Rhodospirillales bacterium RIFCSPLOWO2_02_FULL_58_16]OHC76950.1 MAG: ferritin [Rhodospirillales bacterium RIFCSPLOWO2_12_FULL_58_28]